MTNVFGKGVIVWVCGESQCFKDDIRTMCLDCDKQIFHRPHAFPSSVKLCIPCARIRRGLEGDKAPFVTTANVLDDLDRLVS